MSSHTIVTDGRRVKIELTVTPLGDDGQPGLGPVLIAQPGVGAVVVDSDGRRYFHADDDPPSWMGGGPDGSGWVRWESIKNPRLILSAQ